jgi:E3 ubiquitin-protein ligase MARCH6
MWRGWFWIGDGGWQGFYTRNAARESSSLTGPLSTKTSSIGNGTSPAIGQGIIQFLSSPGLIAGKMSPVNGGAVNDSVLGNTTASRIYPNGLFFDSNPFSNLTRYQAVNNVIIDTLEGQLLTALIVVSFILIFLIREWVVQQQPALAGGAAAAMLPQMEVREENQQPAAEEEEEDDDDDDDDDDDQDLPPFGTAQEEAEEEGRYHRHYHEAEDYDDEELARPRPRAIAPVRRRRFPPAPVENGDAGFESTERPGQGHVLGSGSRDTSLDNTRETSSESPSNHPTRPHVNREVIARAAEVRREMEEKLSFLENAANRYDFGQPTSNDRSFEFRASPGNDHIPESGSSSGSGISERDGVKLPSTVSKYNEDYPRTLDGRDMQVAGSHRNNFWKPHRRESIGSDADVNLGLQSNNHDSPTKQEGYSDRPFASYLGSGATGGSSSHHAPDGSIDRWDMRQSTLEQRMRSNYDNEEQEAEEKPRDKGKGKEIDLSDDMEDAGFGSDDSSTGYLAASDEDEDIETEENKSIEQSISEFLSGEISVSAAEVENSDSSTQPSTPTTSDSQAALADQQPEAALNFNIGDAQLPRRRQLANAGHGHDPARMQELIRQFEAGRVQQPAAQADPAVARGRGAGLWDWIVGDQQNRALDNLPGNAQDLDDMNSDDDEDEDEDDRDIDDIPLRDAPVIPQDVQQAIADEDAADDFDGIMELIGMRGPMAGLVQNAAISSVLITATVALGVAFPYVTGKICMIILVRWHKDESLLPDATNFTV